MGDGSSVTGQVERYEIAMGKMYVLYEGINEGLFWEAGIPEEVAIVQLRFEQYLKEGYIACRIEKNSHRGVQTVEFDPQAEEVILLPMLEGG